MNEESIIGLLLRAHRETAAQAHGEEYRMSNVNAANCYKDATNHIEGAIWNAIFAEQYVRSQEATQAEAKKHAKPAPQ
jgi:hypothetical protein